MQQMFLKKTGQEVFRMDKGTGKHIQVLRPFLPHEGHGDTKNKGEVLNVRASNVTTKNPRA